MSDLDIKRRREAAGITQRALADEVARRSGRSFSQQSLHKLETRPKASSRYMHVILEILAEAESGDLAVAKRELDTLRKEDLPPVLALIRALKSRPGHG